MKCKGWEDRNSKEEVDGHESRYQGNGRPGEEMHDLTAWDQFCEINVNSMFPIQSG